MSDAPMRRYNEFAEANQHDKRIRTLEESDKGFYKTIGSWLNLQSEFIRSRPTNLIWLIPLGELVLHCAILNNPATPSDNPNYLALIKHLVSVVPESIEQKSSEGYTPLHLAVRTENEELVSYLLSIGTNQRQRDKLGHNLMHMMVASLQKRAKTKAEKLESMIKLLDREGVKEMMLERCDGTFTPLALWMSCNKAQYHEAEYKKADFIEVLTKYSTGEELEMINDEGDLPLHTVRFTPPISN